MKVKDQICGVCDKDYSCVTIVDTFGYTLPICMVCLADAMIALADR